jgi:hypothetical protein
MQNHLSMIKPLLPLFLGKEDSSFLKERSKELFYHDPMVPAHPTREISR